MSQSAADKKPSLLHTLYDLSKAPVTFDFGAFLVIADCYRQLINLDYLSLTIYQRHFRGTSARDHLMPMDEKFWRIRNIFHGCQTLLPTITETRYTSFWPTDLQGHTFPPDLSIQHSIYMANAVVELHAQGANPRVFRPTSYATRQVRSVYGKNYVTLTLRTSKYFEDHNSDLDEWYRFSQYLKQKGYRCVVLPDQEDALTQKHYRKYDWTAFEAGAFDLDLRYALYSGAATNFCPANGPTSLLFYTPYSVYQFDQLRGGMMHSDKDFWRKLNGFDVGLDFPWSKEDQRMTWVDSSFETLCEWFERWEKLSKG
jgi:hypothetical protein